MKEKSVRVKGALSLSPLRPPCTCHPYFFPPQSKQRLFVSHCSHCNRKFPIMFRISSCADHMDMRYKIRSWNSQPECDSGFKTQNPKWSVLTSLRLHPRDSRKADIVLAARWAMLGHGDTSVERERKKVTDLICIWRDTWFNQKQKTQTVTEIGCKERVKYSNTSELLCLYHFSTSLSLFLSSR